MGDGHSGRMITLVIPCFDEAARLNPAVMGAAIDERPSWTFLFVDDGSTDETGEILATLRAPREARVSVLSLGSKRGQG